MPDHLLYHPNGQKRSAPLAWRPRPLLPPYTHRVQVRVRYVQPDGSTLLLDPVPAIAWWHSGKSGTRYLHVHHAGLNHLAAGSRVLDEAGQSWEVLSVRKHPADKVCAVRPVPSTGQCHA